ncbi:uncharacterized protein [Aegilops tauschii subsp. strangulata]|uniref:Uncharacterized protein n=9 Tax=Aegilops tauschii subsp. strangulata TaxID=200361 RepID=A0A453IJE1_AEGTS|nr:uncharacterized protein LOC109775083 [Aegilops tauschii subsp. strangulata]XP_040243267.1 uncharacterized protein LOC109775083 [Aegilops tauschii subsp. strangulata]
MNFSDDWRFLFPVSSVFNPPSLAPPDASHGPLFFTPLPPPAPLLSLPFPFPPPLHASTTGDLRHALRYIVGSTSFLPYSDLKSLSGPLLAAPSPPFPPPSNLLAVVPSRSSSSLVLFFPYGENAEKIAFALVNSPVASSAPVSPFVQSDGFKHPGHRIQQLAAIPAQSSWSSEPDDSCVEGFLLAATLYSVNWFRVESRDSGSPVLVPVAKQGFDAAVVHACWSRHFPSQCAVLLENGELCWFDLNTRLGGKTSVGFGGNGEDWGDWLSCAYGAQPWMVIVASTKAVLLVDLSFVDHGDKYVVENEPHKFQYKVLAKVGLPGLFETEPFDRTEHYIAFCKAGFDDSHISVVTERHLILLDVTKPLEPVLAWQHGLENPNHVAMFRLSELRPSKEYEWASNSGFAILVGSFQNGEFSLFCYGPKEQGCPDNSHLYAWDIPSRLSLTGQYCGCSNEIMKEIFSTPVSVYDGYASQHRAKSIVGYYVLPDDLSISEPTSASFALIRLTALGKLEMQQYRASRGLHDEIDTPCDESEHASMDSSSSILIDTQGENVSTKYRFLKLHFLYEHLKGNLCSALAKHGTGVNGDRDQIIISEDVLAFAEDNSRSSSLPVSDFLCNASIPMNVFEIACQSILNSLPSNILHVSLSKYKDMLKCDTKEGLVEYLKVPSCSPHNELRPFLLAKPSSTCEKVTSKAVSQNALVGPVLPVHVLLAMEEMNRGIDSPSERETAETDLVRHRCSEVLEAFVPEVSIAESDNFDGWFSSQKLNDKKSYLVYEPRIENKFTLDKTVIKKENEEQKAADRTSFETSAAPYKDENFMTFVCGKAGTLDSGPEQTTSDLFDFTPVRMDFASTDLDIQPAEEEVYRCLKKQFLRWQNNFKPYQDFCSSYKIQKPS